MTFPPMRAPRDVRRPSSPAAFATPPCIRIASAR